MRLLHVVAGLQESGGGLSEFVPRFALEATRCGLEVTIATVAGDDTAMPLAAADAVKSGVRIVCFPPSFPRPVFYSWSMVSGLGALVHEADIVHVHSNWTFPVWWACECARQAGRPFVMSPHGCLDPVRLAHSAWKKRLAGFFDRRCLCQASVIHATSDVERGWIERYVGGQPRIEVIPNGVDLPDAAPAAAKPARRTRQVLSLGRLHPLKGLDLLIDAWQMASQDIEPGDRWELVIAGPDEQGTRGGLEQKARQYGLSNVRFAGPLYGAEKRRALADADLFALPSRTENFGIAVAEALAAGMPVITTKATPWSELEGNAGWWVDVNADAIANALAAAMRLSDAERAAIGQRGRKIVAAKYQWKTVGRAMTAVYESLVEPK